MANGVTINDLVNNTIGDMFSFLSDDDIKNIVSQGTLYEYHPDWSTLEHYSAVTRAGGETSALALVGMLDKLLSDRLFAVINFKKAYGLLSFNALGENSVAQKEAYELWVSKAKFDNQAMLDFAKQIEPILEDFYVKAVVHTSAISGFNFVSLNFDEVEITADPTQRDSLLVNAIKSSLTVNKDDYLKAFGDNLYAEFNKGNSLRMAMHLALNQSVESAYTQEAFFEQRLQFLFDQDGTKMYHLSDLTEVTN